MSRTVYRGRYLIAGVVAVIAAAGLVACTSDQPGGKPDSSAPSANVNVEKDQAAIDLLPASVKSAGRIVVAMDATQGKPFTYYAQDNKTVTGLTSDLEKALGRTLGLKVDTKVVTFDNLIPGLQAKRYDLSIAPMLMTDVRLKTVDMIGWLHGGSSFLIDGAKGKKDLTLQATCGMTVGATSGSVESDSLTTQSKSCTASGGKAISLKLYPKTTDGIVALQAGRLDAFDTAAAQAAYAEKLNPQLAQSGQPYSSGTSSMAMAKGSPLAKAVSAALQHLIDTGSYKKILAAYGLDQLAVPSASLNKPV